MGVRQVHRGNPALKSTYLVSDLSNGIDTVTSDEVVSSKSMRDLVNVELGEEGVIKKRKGFSEESNFMRMIDKYDIGGTFRDEVLSNAIGLQLLKDNDNIMSVIEGYESFEDFELSYGLGTHASLNRIPFKVEFIVLLNKDGELRFAYLEIENGTGVEDNDKSTRVKWGYIEDIKPFRTPRVNRTPITGFEFLNFDSKVYFELSQVSPNWEGFIEFSHNSSGGIKARKLDRGTLESEALENIIGAYEPSPYEVVNYGFNVLAKDPLKAVNALEGSKRIHAMFLTDINNDKIPLSKVPASGSFTLNVMVSGFNDPEELDIEIYYENTNAKDVNDVKIDIPFNYKPVDSSKNSSIKQFKITNLQVKNEDIIYIEVFEKVDAEYDYYFGDLDGDLHDAVLDFERYLFDKKVKIYPEGELYSLKVLNDKRGYNFEYTSIPFKIEEEVVYDVDKEVEEMFYTSNLYYTLQLTNDKDSNIYGDLHLALTKAPEGEDRFSFYWFNKIFEGKIIEEDELESSMIYFWRYLDFYYNKEFTNPNYILFSGYEGYVTSFKVRDVKGEIHVYSLKTFEKGVNINKDSFKNVGDYFGNNSKSKNVYLNFEYGNKPSLVSLKPVTLLEESNEEASTYRMVKVEGAVIAENIFKQHPTLKKDGTFYPVIGTNDIGYYIEDIIRYNINLGRYETFALNDSVIVKYDEVRTDGYNGLLNGEIVRLDGDGNKHYFRADKQGSIASENFMDDFKEMSKEESEERGLITFTNAYMLGSENDLKETREIETLNIRNVKMTIIQDRLVIYKGNVIRYSDPFKFNYFPFYNYIVLPLDLDDHIVKIQYFKGSYIIFTEKEIWKIEGMLGYEDMVISKVNEMIGCIAPKSIKPINNTLFFLSDKGLYSLKQTMYAHGLENVDKIDNHVEGLIYPNRYSEAIVHKGTYILHNFNVKGEYKDSIKLYFNKYGGSSGRFPIVRDVYSKRPDVKIKIVNNIYGLNEGRLYLFDKGFSDFGEKYPMIIKTPQYTFDYPLHEKKIKDVNFKIKSEKIEPVRVKVYYGSNVVIDPETIKATVNEYGEVEYRDEDYVKFNTEWATLGEFKVGDSEIGGNEYQIHKVITGGKTESTSLEIIHLSEGEVVLHAIGFTFKLGKIRGR